MSEEGKTESRPGLKDWLALLAASVVAMAVVAWPRQIAHREDPWRTVLAGVQSGRQNEGYVAAERALIHFHDLDGRGGRVLVTVAPRVETDPVEVELSAGGRRVRARADARALLVFPFDADTRDLDIDVRSRQIDLPAGREAGARPTRILSVLLERDLNGETALRGLLPLLTGAWALLSTARHGRRFALPFAVLVVAATAASVVAAFDPIYLALGPTVVSRWLPCIFVLVFAAVAILRPSPGIVAVCLAGVILALHVNVVHFGFIYDDRLWARPWSVGEVLGTFAGSEDPLGVSGEQYRPLPSLSHAVDYALWGANAAMFHAVNLAWLSASLFMLFELLRRLGVDGAPAALGAIVCAVHPLAASTAGWISERTDTLAGTFMLAALAALIGPSGNRPARALFLALLALWCKETAVVLPVLAALLIWAALEPGERWARRRGLVGLGVLVIAYVGVWLALFPEKAMLRLATPAPERVSLVRLGMSLYEQILDPIGFEAWRRVRATVEPSALWFAAAMAGAVILSVSGGKEAGRTRLARVAAAGLLWPLVSVIPFKGHHDEVDLYRLGHTPLLGFGICVAALSAVRFARKPWALWLFALAATLRFAPEAQATSAAWGYPGFMFRATTVFNLENDAFKKALPTAMRDNLELEAEMTAHLDAPLEAPWPAVVRTRGQMARRAPGP
jgi:hypothetical protein